MKKVSIWTMSVAVLMLVSCSKSTDADQPDPEPNPVDERVPIQLGTGKILTADVLSRGIGSVGDLEATNSWNGETLYIYGITDKDVALIDNQQATAPTITVPNTTGSIAWTSGGDFYYNSSEVYNFYGYHIDNAATGGAVPVPTKNEVGAYTVDFVINGTQDLMVASTNKTEDILASSKATELTGKEANLYSAWSARRDVTPNLVFKHLLSRLNFKILAGNADAAALANKVHISKIEVYSRSTGTLIIVPKGEAEDKDQGIKNMQAIPADGAAPFLVMQKPTDVAIKELEELVPVAAADATNATPVGVGMLVYPEDSYDITITTSQVIDPDPNPKRETITWKIIPEIKPPASEQGPFVSGAAYNITIKVYALEKIEINSTLTPWTDGGNITVDPDDEPRPSTRSN